MHQKHDMTTPKMTRVTVRVPKTTLDQINEWVDTLGVRRSHFLGIAIVAGARTLISASALEVPPGPSTLAPLHALAEKPPQATSLVGDGIAFPMDEPQGVAAEIERLQAEIVLLQRQLREERGGMKRVSHVAEAVTSGAVGVK